MVDKLLESIEFPDSLESIGYCAFSCYRGGTYSTYVASNLKSVKFGSGLKTIGNYAFYGNRSLETVQFSGENLTSIGEDAFRDCIALSELNITGNGLVIDSNAFYCNYALKSVTLGTGVKTINDYAFRECTSLETVNIGNDVETIGYRAFYYDNNIKQLVLGKGLKNVSPVAFSDKYSNLTVYCYEGTYGHEYAKGMSNVDIKFIHDNYYVADLKASAVSSNSVTMSWKKPNGYDAIDHYIIYKNGAKYDETTDQTYTDINLKSGEEYVYGVAAVDKEGVISEEKTVSVTLPALP